MHLLSRLAVVFAICAAPFFFTLPRASPASWLILLGMAILLGIVWGISASLIRCRVCTMRLLIHQPCKKHRAAPHWPLLGYHTTLAAQSLYSRQVRCPYCGTPNRLSGPPDTNRSSG